VPALTDGSYRNHCPACLYSRHVDVRPGDRANPCGALMAPIGLDHHPAKGFMIVHRCVACGHVGRNRVAAGSDAIDALVALSLR
jgi:hypothetical protein